MQRPKKKMYDIFTSNSPKNLHFWTSLQMAEHFFEKCTKIYSDRVIVKVK